MSKDTTKIELPSKHEVEVVFSWLQRELAVDNSKFVIDKDGFMLKLSFGPSINKSSGKDIIDMLELHAYFFKDDLEAKFTAIIDSDKDYQTKKSEVNILLEKYKQYITPSMMLSLEVYFLKLEQENRP